MTEPGSVSGLKVVVFRLADGTEIGRVQCQEEVVDLATNPHAARREVYDLEEAPAPPLLDLSSH